MTPIHPAIIALGCLAVVLLVMLVGSASGALSALSEYYKQKTWLVKLKAVRRNLQNRWAEQDRERENRERHHERYGK